RCEGSSRRLSAFFGNPPRSSPFFCVECHGQGRNPRTVDTDPRPCYPHRRARRRKRRRKKGMNRKKPRVVVTRKLPDAVETRMMELFDTRLNTEDTPLDAEALAEAMRTADVLVPTVTDRIDAELIQQAGPDLKLIANFGAGVDHIDLKAANRAGIMVTNTPGVLTGDTADMTMALILAAPRRLTEGERLVREGKWDGWRPTALLGHRIWGKRLGIIGMGRIGSAVARRARGFGLTIHYHNRRRVAADL